MKIWLIFNNKILRFDFFVSILSLERCDLTLKAKRTNTAQWIESANRWQINVQRDGVRKTFTSNKPGRTGQREANAKADAWLDQGLLMRTATMNAVWNEYFKSLQLTTGKSNWRPIESRWRTWVAPALGNKRLETLTEQSIQNIVNQAMAAGLSKKTLTSLCCDLRAFFKFAQRCGLTTFFPNYLRVPASARCGERKILQPRDLTILLTEDTTLYKGKRKPDAYIYAYRFQVLTGLRPGELLGLRWEDVRGRSLTIRRAINILGEETQGKNSNAFRSIPLSDIAWKQLKSQGIQKSGIIFPIYSEQHYYRRWKQYCVANGITQTSVYELRHTFVSIAQTLPEAQLRRLVGHSKAMDTYGIYSHLVDGDDKTTSIILDDTFGRFA